MLQSLLILSSYATEKVGQRSTPSESKFSLGRCDAVRVGNVVTVCGPVIGRCGV